VSIWLPTIKSQESPQNTCVKVVCHISLESFRQRLQLCLDLSSIGGLHKKLWPSKVSGNRISRISRLPTWESRTKWHLDVSFMANHKKYYNGEGGGFPPSLGRGESCESVYAHGSSVHEKCSNYALTNLLFSLWRSVWIVDIFVILLSPHPKLQHAPLTPEVLWVKECTLILSSSIVFTFELAFESFKVFGGALMVF
jgi:hypothetical protein